MGPLSFMRSVVDRNVVMRRISVFTCLPKFLNKYFGPLFYFITTKSGKVSLYQIAKVDITTSE